MSDVFRNVYDDDERARAYAELAFPGTYSLAFRDLPALVGDVPRGARALDFGCGTGRSTRFLRDLGLDAIGVDISRPMLDQARALDPAGDYRLVGEGRLDDLGASCFDVILAAFTFDNIPSDADKAAALGSLRRVLSNEGSLILVVSAPEIYQHEWVSFSTRDHPENRNARDGDIVRIVMLDVPDGRPVEDVLTTDARYRELFARAGMVVRDTHHPLATGAEPVEWVSETTIPPWTIYVLSAGPSPGTNH